MRALCVALLILVGAGCASFIPAADLADRYHLSAATAEANAIDEKTRAKVRPCRKAARAAADKTKAAQKVLTASGTTAAAPAGRESDAAQALMLSTCNQAGITPAPAGSLSTGATLDTVLDAITITGGAK